jgi:uncharacterized protein (TIGR00645 family)
MQNLLDKSILASRHLLSVFIFGLAVALGLYAIRFAWKVWKFGAGLFEMEDNDLLLGLLYLLDSALVASLLLMIAMATYDSQVSRLAAEEGGVKAGARGWVPDVDPGNLKIKLATAIIAISSIHLLQVFLKVADYTDREVQWGLIIHGAFLAGGLCLAVMDRLEGTTKAAKQAAKGE